MVAAAAAPSSTIAANRVTLDRPTGSSAFDTIVEKGPQTGEPLLKSDLQKAGENVLFFSNLLGGFVKDWRMKIAKMAADAAIQKMLQETDVNKLAAADAKLQEEKKYWNDRVAQNGNDLPQAKIESSIANERARVSGIIYGARIDINKKQQGAAGLFDDFYNKNQEILHLASLSSMFPDGKLKEISAPLADLQSSLKKKTATVDQVQKLTAAIDEVMRKPENADILEPLQSLSNAWKTYSPKIADELEASQNFASQARNAYASLLTAGSQVGVDSNGGSTKSAAQNQGSLQSNGLSQGVNGIITEFSTLLPKAILSVARSLPSILPEGIKGNTDSSAKDNARINSQEKLQKSTSSLTSTEEAYTEQTKRGTQASTQSAAATDNVKSKVVTLKQSQDELQKSCAAQLAQMPQLTKAANDQADAYRRVAEAQALQKLSGDIQFQQDQMGRSTIDQTVASTQKQYGLPVDMNSASANIIRYNEQLKYARELAGDFASTLVSGLRNGEGLWKSLGKAAISVLTKISDRLLNDVLNSLFKVNSAAAGGGLFGGGGILGGLFGGGGGLDLGILARSPQAAAAVASGIPGLWADGGYTGPGGKHEPAGIVHAGEVVWSQKDIARAGGVGVVEAMRLGRRGYADGGVVGEGGPQLLRAQPDAAVRVRRLRADNQNDASGSASGVHVTVGVSVDEDGNLKAYVKNVAQSEAQSSTRQGLNDFNQQLPDRVAQINRNPRRR